MQVVLDESIQWSECDNLEVYLEKCRKQPMALGQPLMRFGLARSQGLPAVKLPLYGPSTMRCTTDTFLFAYLTYSVTFTRESSRCQLCKSSVFSYGLCRRRAASLLRNTGKQRWQGSARSCTPGAPDPGSANSQLASEESNHLAADRRIEHHCRFPHAGCLGLDSPQPPAAYVMSYSARSYLAAKEISRTSRT